MQQIGFYLDFISPFAYLANSQLPAIAARYGAVIDHRPLDVQRAKLATGNTAPSTRSIADKARFIRRDRLAWASRYGIPMADPASFKAPRLNTGLLLAKEAGVAQAYVDAAFYRVWGLGGDPDDEMLIRDTCITCGLDADGFLRAVEEPLLKDKFEASQNAAWEIGVFGVPIMTFGEQMFWGNDRLDFLEEALAAEGCRSRGES
ncbi:2-hydroxychromene-2-carboxylate isomerase [Ramlibacter albus]|uniref:2-hydroxychromene-2-carboxylate isomerase n=1 Tax=Ramlibacter albus TaxID=2079448 RepID=A0A923M456_9BURK|nr:2-hydroxychromene-2-carboxylate isomerase [Ramlibacter albus]MBC5763045.1 2-hydroxychromene-2-carboxylate isomerase [Ramlibacter albus]